MSEGRRAAVVGWLPHLWALVLGVLLLGPALGRGYVLSFDMVWVPDLALRRDFLGLGGGLPRAVPSDAVVAVLDEVVPGMLLQKLVLLGALLLAAAGAQRLVGPSLVARLVAVSVAVWNPFVAERLAIGHWPVLLGYAATPWLVEAANRARQTGVVPRRLYWLVPLGCLSPSAGMVTVLLLLLVGLGRGTTPAVRLRLLAAVVAGNGPWVVASLVGPGDTTPLQVGASVFNLRAEGTVPAPLTAAGLGGIWNSAVVPASRLGIGGWWWLALVVGLAAAGWRPWWRRTQAPGRWLACWVLGWSVAVLGWAAPGALEWWGSHVPGGGLLRDGTRYYALCLPLVVGLTAAGAEVLAGWVGSRLGRLAAGGAAVALILLPLALMPDAAWGVGGQLRPAHYPDSWAEARGVLERAEQRHPGAVLILPFTAYRAPGWNRGHRVLDPMGRYLTPDYLASDRLSVAGRGLVGDDPRVPRVATALAGQDPRRLGETLRALGVRYVARELTVPAPAAALAPIPGRTILRNQGVELIDLGMRPPDARPAGVTLVLLIGVWGMYALLPLLGTVDQELDRRRRRDR